MSGRGDSTVPSKARFLLSLALLAALLPETITGSTRPEGWLNPLQALFNIWLYGTGVVAVREISLRWKVGYPGILLLGAAYGIVEEGLAVTTFFNPTLPQFADSTLGWYGRLFGVNWVWAVWLSTFHGIVSIAVPIFLVEGHWPAWKGRRSLSDPGLALDLLLLAGCVVTINVAVHSVNSYAEDPFVYVGAVLAIVLLANLARSWADRVWAEIPAIGPRLSRRGYAAAGFLFLLALFLVYGGGPSLGRIPAVTFLEGFGLTAFAILLLRRTVSTPDGAMQRLAFVAGAVFMFCILDLFFVVAGDVTMAIPAAGFGGLVVWLYRERAARAPVPPTAAGV